MATQNKITEMIAAIKTIYPYYAKEANIQILVRTWNLLLKDYPDNITEAAFLKCLQTCKMPPTPADVIENIKAITEATEPTDEELWNELTIALRKTERLIYYFRFNAIEANGLTQGENAQREAQAIWESLSDKIKQYLGGKSEFMRMAQGFSDDELKFERSRFLKAMPTIQKRKEFTELLIRIESDKPELLNGAQNE